jgi:hypothetical protein
MDAERPDPDEDDDAEDDSGEPAQIVGRPRSFLPAGLESGGPPPSGGSAGARAVKESAIPAGDHFHTAILGPVASGKTYLFRAIVYRLSQEGQQGVISRYLAPQGVGLWTKTVTKLEVLNGQTFDYSRGRSESLYAFNAPYRRWEKLPRTSGDAFDRHTLVIDYSTGWRGQKVKSMCLTFLDCAGEVQKNGRVDPLGNEAWNAYRDARVVVFCLPAWAAFPADPTVVEASPVLHGQAWRNFVKNREDMLDQFQVILENYTSLWQEMKRPPIRVMLALTQADDVTSGLRTLADRWIREFGRDSGKHLARLARGGGTTKYLTAGRQVSQYVSREFSRATEQRVRKLPSQLALAGKKPWIIPVSAIDGAVLAGRKPHDGNEPEPVHVELPLLLALCEAHNALM